MLPEEPERLRRMLDFRQLAPEEETQPIGKGPTGTTRQFALVVPARPEGTGCGCVTRRSEWFPRLAVFVGLVPTVPEGNIREALEEAEREQILATPQKEQLGRGGSGRRCRASWPEAIDSAVASCRSSPFASPEARNAGVSLPSALLLSPPSLPTSRHLT